LPERVKSVSRRSLLQNLRPRTWLDAFRGRRIPRSQVNFEDLYQRQRDPWEYETSDVEQARYEAVLRALGPRKFDRALEIGCSVGVFTELLAPRCDELLAVDFVDAAVEIARERLADTPSVTVERRAIPREMPAGDFDLIVCMDTLYYWTRDVQLKALGAFEAALRKGGSLLIEHESANSRFRATRGDRVHFLVEENADLEHAVSMSEAGWRVDRFDKLW
jgi:SAM-dependent methyltransferase